ncbi:BrnT family toxin [Devosia sp. Root436]|uniref:BrnT family toxin n=1 Tax=Devosia sp. Root436 TaxID=1736537 RepID=UPI0009E76217|nr:BrnT family toxin [Devosia sp. Root436]
MAQEFKWDENKNRSNFVKHGIRFETAARAFLDPYAVQEQDRYVDGEERWQTTGLIDAVHIVVVAHTIKDNINGTEIIRIISARPAERHEARGYERARMGLL